MIVQMLTFPFMMQSTDYYTNSYLSNWHYEQIRKDTEKKYPINDIHVDLAIHAMQSADY